ncbi:MAG: hypothetical protein HYT06_00530, partial [Candidatus Levybacteria bacterium]|nr:hypothetical protein [Candidatus Levybacteria bacterium]
MSIQELGETLQPVTKRLLKTYRKTLQGLGVDVEDIRRHERYMSDPQERAQRAALEGTVDEDYALTHEDVSGLTSHLANQTDSIRSSVPSLNGR